MSWPEITGLDAAAVCRYSGDSCSYGKGMLARRPICRALASGSRTGRQSRPEPPGLASLTCLAWRAYQSAMRSLAAFRCPSSSPACSWYRPRPARVPAAGYERHPGRLSRPLPSRQASSSVPSRFLSFNCSCVNRHLLPPASHRDCGAGVGDAASSEQARHNGSAFGARHRQLARCPLPVWPADAGLMSAQRRTDGV